MNKHIAEIREIILHEGEGRSIDFKAVEYKSETYHELLKDILAMANSSYSGNRYIICGVKHVSDSEKQILGIEGTPADSAGYTQLFNANIEPEVHFEYIHFYHEDKLLTAFVVHDCNDQPYMMKKAYGKRQGGDCFIRKGSSTDRLMRGDIDRIFEQRYNSKFFSGELDLHFKETSTAQISVRVIPEFALPSADFRRKAERVLQYKESQDYISQAFNTQRPSGPLDQLNLENMTTGEIRSTISAIPENFVQEDQFYQYETTSFKLNAEIINNGDEYLRDVSVKIVVEAPESLVIPERIMHRQINVNTSNGIRRGFNLEAPAALNEGYPWVNRNDGQIMIECKIGDLKHGLAEDLFRQPLRLVVTNPQLVGQRALLYCQFFGEGLREPVTKTLTINFV